MNPFPDPATLSKRASKVTLAMLLMVAVRARNSLEVPRTITVAVPSGPGETTRCSRFMNWRWAPASWRCKATRSPSATFEKTVW